MYSSFVSVRSSLGLFTKIHRVFPSGFYSRVSEPLYIYICIYYSCIYIYTRIIVVVHKRTRGIIITTTTKYDILCASERFFRVPATVQTTPTKPDDHPHPRVRMSDENIPSAPCVRCVHRALGIHRVHGGGREHYNMGRRNYFYSLHVFTKNNTKQIRPSAAAAMRSHRHGMIITDDDDDAWLTMRSYTL